MEMSRFRLLPLVILLFLCHACVDADETNHQQKTYIIHMDKSDMPASFDDLEQWYDSSLKLVSASAEMLYTYNNVVHGYSARLTSEEARLLEEHPGVLSVQEEVQYELHTTRSPEFLGLLTDKTLPVSNRMSEVIIGMIDTGVWPESRSFHDKELSPVPRGWKGECEVGKTFYKSSCNRKLIGARYFSKGYEAERGPINETHVSKSPRDDDGHGTHTATTAAGSTVVGASLFGYAAGTAHGMAKYARLAVYKVCWLGDCLSSDILAGMEKAIEDGVNILSVSLGASTIDYFRDAIAIAAFTATSRGIFVSCSAGNDGPFHESLSNVAPWITTVGAGTIDRQFPAYITLGNGKKFTGSSLYSGKPLPSSFTPLVFAGNVNRTFDGNLCSPKSLIPGKVKGKIVICDRDGYGMASQGLAVKDAGGIGIIIANTEFDGRELVADAHFIPAATVTYTAGDIIKKYALTEPNPTATIATGYTKVGVQPSPVIALFSSRGPNPVTKDVLKPDLIAPGVEILAGWTRKVGPTELPEDTRQVDFNIISGTSMSCPHVSGLAALIKAAHPEWSPSAIRSALMTTAYNTYKNGQRIQDLATGLPATPYDYGAGHVDPTSALDPGLVYDATIDNYIDFLCAINYSSSMIKTITKQDHSCKNGKKYRVGDLNYPAFSVLFRMASGKGRKSSAPIVVKYTRTLTNVGNPATYKVSLSKETKAVKIMVEPKVLAFSKPNEKKRFTVTFTARSMPPGTTRFDYLKWMDGKHIVGSPIAFSWS
ncbi:subtilisin-like protease SBT1.7 [Olea europaea var. sylvestris]|uniref:Subtilisin-like protease n=1 Tax=Olea europaea subsp. europaea TaxID=158383 RepID=A0A8S0RM46_OLEEU|nr:subtilisin-like protease SBT1.7 [Olea europaea var. sylvestris]CAA2980290.1 subtilisin-like protease [Olea europaea subsp. europaea]